MSMDAILDLFQAAETGYEVYEKTETAKSEKKEARENEALSLAEAKAAQDKAAYDAALKREQNERLSSKQRALFAKAGIEIDSGTPLMVLAEQAKDMEEDALNIEAMGEVEYRRHMSTASIWNTRAREAERTGNVGAVGTILKSTKKLFFG